VRFLLLNPFFDSGVAWTVVNCLYALLTFYFFHWVKVLPWPYHPTKDATLTVWEQIDNEKHWTPTKKFFMILPVVLFLIALQSNPYSFWEFFWNSLALTLSIVPTLPECHRWRPFGINDGLDDWR